MRLFNGSFGRRRSGTGLLGTPLWLGLCLLLWSTFSIADKTAADYYVESLPGQPDGPLLTMHAG